MRRWVLCALSVGFALAAAVDDASATLTTSEREQVKQAVASAQAGNAGRVRAFVARPDLTAEESAQVMAESLAPLAFTDTRAAFLREVVFGGASAASRPVLAVAAVRGALANTT